jgi:3-oxoacyl-[acyl-carrier-protein] synthase II
VSLREVVVTGIGVILPNCDERTTLWAQLAGGETQVRPDALARHDAPGRMVGRIWDFDGARYLADLNPRHLAHCHREQQVYLASIAQAARDAGFEPGQMRGKRFGLFDGTSRSCFAHWYELFTQRAAGRPLTLKDLSPGMPGQTVGMAAALFGLTGPSMTFNATCASGAVAIGSAFHQLQTGRADLIFATGHDTALVEPLFDMYRDAGLLSTELADPANAISPYTGHHGNVFGEGAITLVLETREHAEDRGAPLLAEVTGFRHENGGMHPTDVDFTAERPSHTIRTTLDDARTPLEEVDFVVGHGNGVRASDISELNYMKHVFGARSRQIPLLSTKPVYGHTLGASSALNAAAAALMLKHDYVIPTLGVDERRVVHGFNHQAKVGMAKPLRSGVVVSYGIGGQNAVLTLSKVSP